MHALVVDGEAVAGPTVSPLTTVVPLEVGLLPSLVRQTSCATEPIWISPAEQGHVGTSLLAGPIATSSLVTVAVDCDASEPMSTDRQVGWGDPRVGRHVQAERRARMTVPFVSAMCWPWTSMRPLAVYGLSGYRASALIG